MSADTSPVIIADRVTKRFGDFTAVNAISFTVAPGEVFGFLGANGAGKTTAMRIFCGLLAPSSGAAKVVGFDVASESEAIKARIGYMSQKFSLYGRLTIRENIRFYGGVYGVDPQTLAARSEEILQRIDLSGSADHYVNDLPLGYKQRLSFAVATLHRPKLVFLDEPTGGVDPIARRQFWEMITEAAATGTTVFVTTHYMDEAEYCDRVSIMVDGTIAALGTPADLQAMHGVHSMQDVFIGLARKAVRSGD